MIKNGHKFIKFNINEKPLFIFLEHNLLDDLASYCIACHNNNNNNNNDNNNTGEKRVLESQSAQLLHYAIP